MLSQVYDEVKDDRGMQKQHGSLGPEARGGGMFKREKVSPHGCSLAPGQRERMCDPKHHIRQVKDLRHSIQGPVPRKRKKNAQR